MKYIINNFLLYELNETEVIVQTNETIVNISHKSMINLIKYIDKNNFTTINHKNITQFLGTEKEDGIAFLEHYNIIRKRVELSFNINKILFYSNNEDFINVFKEYFSESLRKYKDLKLIYSKDTQVIDEEIGKSETVLLIAMLNPYNKAMAISIDEISKKKNVILNLNFSYNFKFYFGNLYYKKWKNPCHKCLLENIETSYRNGKNISKNKYQNIIDTMYLKDSNFEVSINLSKRQVFNIIEMAFNYFEKTILKEKYTSIPYNESLEKIHECYEYNLDTKELFKNIAIHGELCDCYE